MVTLEELRRENARLKAEASVREDFRSRDEERRKLSRENRGLKHSGKLSAAKRIGNAFKQTGAVTMSGLGKVGKGLKSYAEYKQGPAPGIVPKLKSKSYYKKIGKGKYKKVVVHSKVKQPSQQKERRGFIESDIMRPTGNWGGLGGYK